MPEPIDLQVLLIPPSPIIRVGEVPGSNPGAPIEKPRSGGVFVGQEPLLPSARGAESDAYCPFTAQTWPSTSALRRSRSPALRRIMCE
jgi:hypothetical protein